MQETKLALVHDGLVDVREASAFLGVCVTRVYALMSEGQLPYCKIGRSRRIPKQALRELAAQTLHGIAS